MTLPGAFVLRTLTYPNLHMPFHFFFLHIRFYVHQYGVAETCSETPETSTLSFLSILQLCFSTSPPACHMCHILATAKYGLREMRKQTGQNSQSTNEDEITLTKVDINYEAISFSSPLLGRTHGLIHVLAD